MERRLLQIQVNIDSHISGGDSLNPQVESVVMDAVDQFSDRITRVEVHLSDKNGGKKSGSNGKRCMIEARLGGMQPITVSDDGESVQQALDGPASKLPARRFWDFSGRLIRVPAPPMRHCRNRNWRIPADWNFPIATSRIKRTLRPCRRVQHQRPRVSSLVRSSEIVRATQSSIWVSPTF